MNLIELKNAVKEYTVGDVTVRALNDISLAVKPGEVIIILGDGWAGCPNFRGDFFRGKAIYKL